MADCNRTIQDQFEQEIWKQVIGFSGYEVSSHGRVRSCKTFHHNAHPVPYIMKTGKSRAKIPYSIVSLQVGRKVFHRLIHRMVLEAFVGACPYGMQACHNDGNPNNNCLSNLRWDTPKNNNYDKVLHGTWQGGSRNGNSKLTEEQVSIIISMKGKESARSLASKFMVTVGMIYFIWRRRNWRHVTQNSII